jgi:hypothetical protein
MQKYANVLIANVFIVTMLFLVPVVIIAIGCLDSSVAPKPQIVAESRAFATEQSSEGLMIDAGIFFTDETSYFCIPCERLGITELDEVTSIRATCECVRPAFVRYLSSSGIQKSALRLTIEKDLSDRAPESGLSLGVIVTVQLAKKPAIELTVSFIHTASVKCDELALAGSVVCGLDFGS